MSTQEIWKPIEGYEGLYEVSDSGQVRRRRVLKQHLAGKGYRFVSLSKDGEVRQRYVHHLVAEAFIGPRPTGNEIAHRNGDKGDNSLTNLRYDTPASNNADKVAHGTDGVGERNSYAKLTWKQVREIRALKGTESQRSMARRFGVSQGAISDILCGRNWQQSGSDDRK